MCSAERIEYCGEDESLRDDKIRRAGGSDMIETGTKTRHLDCHDSNRPDKANSLNRRQCCAKLCEIMGARGRRRAVILTGAQVFSAVPSGGSARRLAVVATCGAALRRYAALAGLHHLLR